VTKSSVVTEACAILQREVTKTIESFTDQVHFGIVLFNAPLAEFPEGGAPAQATSVNKKGGVYFVATKFAGVAGCVDAGLHESLNMANRAPEGRNMLILLWNGSALCPGAEAGAFATKVLQEVSRWNFKKIPIHVVMVGGSDETFSRRLASLNNGTFRRIYD
jgi:hypothetical protein